MPLLSFIAALQRELERHTWDTFVDEPPPIAQGGSGVVVVGCPACRVRLNTMNQFMRHLTQDVLPKAVQETIVRKKRSTISRSERLGDGVPIPKRTVWVIEQSFIIILWI